jgi:hypothetical protein
LLCAEAWAFTLDLDAPAVQLDEVAHDRQSESKSAVTPRRRAVGLTEALEHVRQELRLDPEAGVGHAQLQMRGGTRERDADPAVGRRELHGVGEQIPDHLLQAIGIAVHHVAG